MEELGDGAGVPARSLLISAPWYVNLSVAWTTEELAPESGMLQQTFISFDTLSPEMEFSFVGWAGWQYSCPCKCLHPKDHTVLPMLDWSKTKAGGVRAESVDDGKSDACTLSAESGGLVR